MMDEREYIIQDLRRMVIRVGANEHWYKQTWLGVPVWQVAEDLLRLQKIIYQVKPRWIIETGTKFGGSAIFFASILTMIGHGDGGVVTCDIEIQPAATEVFATHPLGHMIRQVEGDAASAQTLAKVMAHLPQGDTRDPLLVFLDDNHNADHVLAEMELYAPLVSPNSYLIVADTVFADLAGTPVGRSTPKYPDMQTSNPRQAVLRFLEKRGDFLADVSLAECGPGNFEDGFLKRISGSS
jgi:cephalosporin hydroxylase